MKNVDPDYGLFREVANTLDRWHQALEQTSTRLNSLIEFLSGIQTPRLQR